ncbi:dihydrodipicolinate synthase family protein [Nocardiopsis sp. TSRI0078]|uniref:dihydrodipicolinate synthase family protein n=1 Tax=unclassified Nocardiopsis TaxID=2649073 RepID=UPI00093DFA2E|nr:dihydrodipicolinate synthase family protein [Nocardiopsis sp. TSRI0078]OKI23688.1 dihydrodipicolinate synthase family protein [Nocardiopsis sp. TSRI0078]
MPAHAQVITALPTPFTANEELDTGAVRDLVTAVRDRGADGVFAAGTTGEFTALDDDERLQVVRIALEVFGPDGVYAHVGAAAPRQAERLARAAVSSGARRLAAVTPFFLPAPEDALLRYYERIVAAAGDAEVHAYLFRVRSTTPAPPSVLRRLAEVGVRGVKISGESDDSVRSYLEAAPGGFSVLSGNDVAFGELVRAGGTGVVSGVSSVFPKPFVTLRDALRAGDREGAAAAGPLVERAVAAVKGGSIPHLKAGLDVQGLSAGPARVCEGRVSAEDLDVLRETARALS